jgi:hypothetical protein
LSWGYDDRNLNDFNKKLNDYKNDLEKMSVLVKQLNITVINLTPNSALKCYEFKDIKEIL